MNYEIVKLDEKIIVGQSIVTTNVNGRSVEAIGQLWQSFIGDGVQESIEGKVSGKGIGLYTAYEGNEEMSFKFMCGMEVSEINETHLETILIPAASYAKFRIQGHMVHDVAKAWQNIWALSLNRKYECDFEVYHNDSEDITCQTIDIYISINC